MASLSAHIKGGKQLLDALPPIAQLSPRVWRFLGGNPGPYTLTGTNVYLVGSGPTRVLVDAGEGDNPGFLETLAEGMRQAGARALSEIVVTHWHHDHLGGVPGVVAALARTQPTPPRVRKYMPDHDEALYGGEGSVDPYSVWPRASFVPLADGEVVRAEGATLRALHTPGHANDHVVLVLEEERAMFSADNVLGQGTCVFQDLTAYMASLRSMASAVPEGLGRLYPGHGPVVENGPAKIQDYIVHRTKRIAQAIEVLAGAPRAAAGEGGAADTHAATVSLTLEKITRLMYPEIPDALIPPASVNTRQVLLFLQADGVARQLADSGTWELAVPVADALERVRAKM